MLGTSSNLFDAGIVQLLRQLKPGRVMELGCGRGKFADLCRTAMPQSPPAMVAVQRLFAEDERAMLASSGYAEVIDRDILEYFREGFDERYDLIAALDVIEHFLLHDALSIIGFALYRCDYLLLVWPTSHPQDAQTCAFDRHRYSFTLRELTSHFDVVHYQQTGFAQAHFQHAYHLALLRGYMNHRNPAPIVLG